MFHTYRAMTHTPSGNVFSSSNGVHPSSFSINCISVSYLHLVISSLKHSSAVLLNNKTKYKTINFSAFVKFSSKVLYSCTQRFVDFGQPIRKQCALLEWCHDLLRQIGDDTLPWNRCDVIAELGRLTLIRMPRDFYGKSDSTKQVQHVNLHKTAKTWEDTGAQTSPILRYSNNAHVLYT